MNGDDLISLQEQMHHMHNDALNYIGNVFVIVGY